MVSFIDSRLKFWTKPGTDPPGVLRGAAFVWFESTGQTSVYTGSVTLCPCLCGVFICFFLCFKMSFGCVALPGREITLQIRIAKNLQRSSSLCLRRAGITGAHLRARSLSPLISDHEVTRNIQPPSPQAFSLSIL